jgi:hypothetical protein
VPLGCSLAERQADGPESLEHPRDGSATAAWGVAGRGRPYRPASFRDIGWWDFILVAVRHYLRPGAAAECITGLTRGPERE